MKIIADSIHMAVRDLRNLSRQPWFVAITLFQPIIWLLLFGQLFRKIIEIPGFGATNYIAFLTPGVVVMNAFYSGGWSGMGMVNDLDRGVMDRFLITPVSRTAIIIGRMIQVCVTTIVQAAILVVLGLILGANWPHAGVGIPILFASAILLAVPFAALSNALGLLLRQEESVIGANQFILLPLTFISAVFLPQLLMPHWMQTGSDFNPLNWAVTAGRGSFSTDPNWGNVLVHLAYLGILTVVATWLAALAFRSYQRSI